MRRKGDTHPLENRLQQKTDLHRRKLAMRKQETRRKQEHRAQLQQPRFPHVVINNISCCAAGYAMLQAMLSATVHR